MQLQMRMDWRERVIAHSKHTGITVGRENVHRGSHALQELAGALWRGQGRLLLSVPSTAFL